MTFPRRPSLAFVASGLAALSACGGVPDSRPISEVTEEDAQAICEDFPYEEYTCEIMGTTVTFATGMQDCENAEVNTDSLPADCDATVGDWRDCDKALRDMYESCEISTSVPECDAVMACFQLEVDG